MHVYRTPRVRGAADAQLPVAVVPPALDPAPGRNYARVEPTRGNGECRDAWRQEGERSAREGKSEHVLVCVCQSVCVCLCVCVCECV